MLHWDKNGCLVGLYKKWIYFVSPLSGLDSRNKLGLAIAPSVLHHARVLIDIEGGRQLLIHRAGKSPTSEFEYSDTVVEDWANMDMSIWKVQDSEILERNRTAYDVWKHGLPTKKYNLFLANRQHAANRMFTKGK